MDRMKLYIKTFDMETAFSLQKFEKLISDLDSHIPAVNKPFEDNQDAIRLFKGVSGSPKLASLTSEFVDLLNSIIESSAELFDCLRDWSNKASDKYDEVLGVNVPRITQSINRVLLDKINEDFKNGNVGIESFSDARTYINSIQDVVTNLKEHLGNVTDDIVNADGAFPSDIHNALTRRISKINDDIYLGYDKVIKYLNTNVEQFVSQLNAVINDMSAGISLD